METPAGRPRAPSPPPLHLVHQMRAPAGNLRLVAQHKLRMAGRRFAYNVRNTFEGKVALIALLAAPFLMRSMLASSSLRAATASRDLAVVTLTCAHTAMVVALVMGVAGNTARTLMI